MGSDNSSRKLNTQDFEAEYLHQEEIMCPLPRPDIEIEQDTVIQAHVYDITVSNDGQVFGSHLYVVSTYGSCLMCTLQQCNSKVMY